jgi:hypothetical protein
MAIEAATTIRPAIRASLDGSAARRAGREARDARLASLAEREGQTHGRLPWARGLRSAGGADSILGKAFSGAAPYRDARFESIGRSPAAAGSHEAC